MYVYNNLSACQRTTRRLCWLQCQQIAPSVCRVSFANGLQVCSTHVCIHGSTKFVHQLLNVRQGRVGFCLVSEVQQSPQVPLRWVIPAAQVRPWVSPRHRHELRHGGTPILPCASLACIGYICTYLGRYVPFRSQVDHGVLYSKGPRLKECWGICAYYGRSFISQWLSNCIPRHYTKSDHHVRLLHLALRTAAPSLSPPFTCNLHYLDYFTITFLSTLICTTTAHL